MFARFTITPWARNNWICFSLWLNSSGYFSFQPKNAFRTEASDFRSFESRPCIRIAASAPFPNLSKITCALIPFSAAFKLPLNKTENLKYFRILHLLLIPSSRELGRISYAAHLIINSIRVKAGIDQSDIVIVKFGEKYRQWNAAFDAGIAIGKGIPVVVMHAPELTHALKEIDAAALAVTETPQQVVEILQYISQD